MSFNLYELSENYMIVLDLLREKSLESDEESLQESLKEVRKWN
ncbi:hypothetical protein HMPREF3187_01189 [Aerococcus christensenii]|uniref:Uncharacterized protein n=1 Tax=Aerococcus christensenii TaxID=87541 RepID=A0A133XWX9_9LACT|nr:hypothetical protein [Aerococcus christensenii]KXB35456.1 hypothetical protein HMPREF3187_01189 [Aerococcus christensenii]